jgi:hypothetical protein
MKNTMTTITQLIDAVTPRIPFANEMAAETFLGHYGVDDQAALISALYIGRDHIHASEIRPDYVPQGMAFNRFFTTGDAQKWLIEPSDFARILYEKNTNLTSYLDAFLRCVQASNYSLTAF